MKIFVLILLAIVLLEQCDSHQTQTSIFNFKEGEGLGGVWKSRVEWKVQWVKDWETKKIYVPVWKKVWSPVNIREWFPLPKPPKDWDPHPPHHPVQPSTVKLY
ncbi:uncharacterized protein LOC109595219 [Aethina tumida]|uniref:uncharacterized protein LOC109595219 n=1 Tax=Aethina tumida TaxID=116153 RepID=UPI00096B433A|nr:uncharacterized protein LOC109595219 [Aethina tumida]